MKIQLLVPPGGYFAERWSKGTSMPPLGLLYIAAVLEEDGHEVRVIPTDIMEWNWARIRDEISDYHADIIGVTATTENRFQSFRLIKEAKKANPDALTVLGGPHASMAGEDCLEHILELDLVVKGEGEMTMLELCREMEKNRELPGLSTISGLVIRNNGKIQPTPLRMPIQDLDSLPYPAFHLVPFEKYNFVFEVPGQGKLPAVNMMTSRGCPFNCSFCATPINWGRTVRMRSPQHIIKEIEFLKNTYKVQVFFFFDDTFNASPKRAEDICDLILERNLNIYWKCDVRMDILEKPLLTKMKEAGLFHLSFGLEAGSRRIRNEIINKKVDIKDFQHMVEWCQDLDIIPNAFFIFSHPTETWEEAQETIQIIEQYRERIEGSIAILHIYPGTPLEKLAREQGILPKDFTWAKKHHSQIITLPTAQGDVPLYIDKLTWAQISELVFRWSFSSSKTSVVKKIPQIFRNIHSFGDIKRYAIMAFVYLRLKIKK